MDCCHVHCFWVCNSTNVTNIHYVKWQKIPRITSCKWNHEWGTAKVGQHRQPHEYSWAGQRTTSWVVSLCYHHHHHYYYFLRQVFSWAWNLLSRQGWQASSLLALLCGCWKSNSGPHASKSTTLPTEPIRQQSKLLVLVRLPWNEGGGTLEWLWWQKSNCFTMFVLLLISI